jgi:hypothetical protein
VRPTKALGSLARVLMGLASRDVFRAGTDRLVNHAHHTSIPSQSQASINSASESGWCPISSPSGGDGREIYHPMMRFGNYPFVGGTRPDFRRNYGRAREGNVVIIHRMTSGHARVMLTQRAQAAMFSGRTGCSQAECRGSQVHTSRHSHHVCAEICMVLRLGA